MEQKQGTCRVLTDLGLDDQTVKELNGRVLQTNAERIKGNVEVSRRATSQPLPTLSLRTAAPFLSSIPLEKNYQGKIENVGHNIFQSPQDGFSSKTYEKAHNVKKNSVLQPEHQTDHNQSYKPSHPSRKTGQASREAGSSGETATAPRNDWLSGLWTTDNTVARQATDLT